jgi:C4-dicarboxylate-specific signal transduction histidine kinase
VLDNKRNEHSKLHRRLLLQWRGILQDDLRSLATAYQELEKYGTKIKRLADDDIIGIVIWNAEGIIFEANDAFFCIVGDEDLDSRRIRGTDAAPAERREPDERAWREIREAGRAHANRVAALGQVAASIAHEVAQPIAAAATSAKAALRWLSAEQPNLKEARHALGCTVDSGKRAVEIVDGIRALFSKAPPRKARVDINAAVREMIELTRREAMTRGVSVQVELTDDLPFVEGDRVELQQVLVNLITNAFEAMSGICDGVRELRICTGLAAAGCVLVTVSDSGPGIAPHMVERVFTSFYTTKPKGMGMGLSICRSIVEAHDGRLWVSANDPRGAVFQFTVPAEPADSPRSRGMPN